MAQAMEALDNELRAKWHLARSNPEMFQGYRKGADMLRSKFEALLTGDDAWV